MTKHPEDVELLAESIELEKRSDLFAAAGDLREATMLMREVNKIRASVFGKLDPNELRERASKAITRRVG